MLFELTHQQARRLATSTASRIYDMDATRPKDWHTTPTECSLTRSDQQYRAELEDAYNAIMKQLSGR